MEMEKKLKLGSLGEGGINHIPICVATEIRNIYSSGNMNYSDIPDPQYP